jgi:hypothetical protein
VVVRRIAKITKAKIYRGAKDASTTNPISTGNSVKRKIEGVCTKHTETTSEQDVSVCQWHMI